MMEQSEISEVGSGNVSGAEVFRSGTEARAELKLLLELMGFEDAKIELFEQEEGEVLLHVESTEAARLIGRGAQVLNALQYVLNRIMYNRDRASAHCIVDVERYRERHRDRLLKEAFDAMERVRRSGRAVRLAPMPAADRRIIHQAVKGHGEVRTYSEEADEEGLKRVVVAPAEEQDGSIEDA